MATGTPSKVAARNFVLEISDGAGTPTYYQVEGLKTITRTTAAAKTDITDFASAGNHEHWVMEHTHSLKIEGTRQKATGQKVVEALSDLTGLASLRAWRLTFPALPLETTPEKWTFLASAVFTDEGGGNNDVDKWGCDVEVSGAITKVLGS